MAEIPKGGRAKWFRKITVEFKHPSKRCFIPSSLTLLLPRRPYFFLHFHLFCNPTYARVQFFFSPPFSPFSPLATLFYPFASSFSLFSFLLFFHRVSLLFAQRRFKRAPKPRRFYSRPLLHPLVP